jgi:hypothetical protein
MGGRGAGRLCCFGLLTVAATAFGLPGAASAAPAAAGATVVPPRVAVPGPTQSPASGCDPVAWYARNWSGYALTCTNPYNSVGGSWTVPTVNPPAHPKKAHQYSATWIGIDGFNSDDSNLIQAGTEQDWRHGVASYQAWWEILPADETPIPSITVHPGDVMTVSIAQGSPDWTITIADTTTHQSFSTEQPFSGDGSSAEWIQEAPTVNGRFAPLAHDSTIIFQGATANGVNPGLTTEDSGIMVKHGKAISTPSAPDAAGDGFAVAFGKVVPPPPS